MYSTSPNSDIRIILRAMTEGRDNFSHTRLEQVVQFLKKDTFSIELKAPPLKLPLFKTVIE